MYLHSVIYYLASMKGVTCYISGTNLYIYGCIYGIELWTSIQSRWSINLALRVATKLFKIHCLVDSEDLSQVGSMSVCT